MSVSDCLCKAKEEPASKDKQSSPVRSASKRRAELSLNEVKTKIYYFGNDSERIKEKFDEEFAFNGFNKEKDLYISLGKSLPDALLIDFSFVDDPESFVQDIKSTPGLENLNVVAIVDDPEIEVTGFDMIISRNDPELADKIVDQIYSSY